MKYPKFWICIYAIVAAMIAACLCSCRPTRQTRTIENVSGTCFDVIEIDSCEYVIGNSGYKGYMAHKGNCKYCAERNKKNKQYYKEL